MMRLAADERRNIVYDGTLSNPDLALARIEYLQAADYRVEIHAMAVSPDLSKARIYNRREEEILASPTRFGRTVSEEFHDQSVKGLVATIERLQKEGKVDAIVLYDREGKAVTESRLIDGQWTPPKDIAAELRVVHQDLPDRATLQAINSTYNNAARAMRGRGADPDEQRRVDQLRDAAAFRAMTQEERVADPRFNGAAKVLAAANASIDERYGRDTAEAQRMRAGAMASVSKAIEDGRDFKAPMRPPEQTIARDAADRADSHER
jgi:hypothetical protein